MQELMTNFKNKYGQMIPLPKIYQDEDSSDSEGLALADGTRYGRKTPGGSRGKGGGGKGGSGGMGPKLGPLCDSGDRGGTGGSVGRGVLVADSRVSAVETTTMTMMTLTSAGRWVMMANHQEDPWLIRNHASRAQHTLQLTETCHLFTSLVQRRELNWVIGCWNGLQHKSIRYTRRGCKEDKSSPTDTEQEWSSLRYLLFSEEYSSPHP